MRSSIDRFIIRRTQLDKRCKCSTCCLAPSAKTVPEKRGGIQVTRKKGLCRCTLAYVEKLNGNLVRMINCGSPTPRKQNQTFTPSLLFTFSSTNKQLAQCPCSYSSGHCASGSRLPMKRFAPTWRKDSYEEEHVILPHAKKRTSADSNIELRPSFTIRLPIHFLALKDFGYAAQFHNKARRQTVKLAQHRQWQQTTTLDLNTKISQPQP